jgi:hypothetical protein
MRESANEIAPRRLVYATTADCSGEIQISPPPLSLSLFRVYVAQSSTRVAITFPLYLPFLCTRRFYYRALKLARVTSAGPDAQYPSLALHRANRESPRSVERAIACRSLPRSRTDCTDHSLSLSLSLSFIHERLPVKYPIEVIGER